MTAFKEPIPVDWRPDPAKSYEQRYPMRLPGETAGSDGVGPASEREGR
jgi:hypothetical protein